MDNLLLEYSIILDNWTAVPKMRIHHQTHYKNTKTLFRKYILPNGTQKNYFLGN